MNQQSQHAALQSGYALHWYRIESVLGQGAFGITYLAHDINLDRQVAIKEYLPGQFSVRNNDFTVRPTTDAHKEDFEWGLKRFISEAKILTKFEHSNLVRVFNVFEMNNTAYMVMNYEMGKSLQQVLKSRKTLSEKELMKILIPLLGGLEVMHAKGFVHRDIKPGNIYIRHDGSPVLLDFGSARQTRAESGREMSAEQTVTTLVSPGYAPIEQYGSNSNRQGPWTDIYGLGATLYKAVTGKMPLPAVDRSETLVHDMVDGYQAIANLKKGQYSEKFLAAIDHALVFKADERPQSVADWHAEFTAIENDNVVDTTPESQTLTGEEVTVKLATEHEAVTINLGSESEMETEKIDTAKTIPVRVSKLNNLKSRWLFATAVVVVSVTLLLVNSFDTDKPTPVINPAINTGTPSVDESTPEIAQAITSDLTDEQQLKINDLLQRAEIDIAELRLTSPNENNALNKYMTILMMDENNAEAHAGVQLISDKYISLAYGAIKSNNLEKADAYIAKAESVDPESDNIVTVRNALQAKYEEQKRVGDQQTAKTEKSDGLWESVKKWNEEHKAVETEESAVDKKIRESFK